MKNDDVTDLRDIFRIERDGDVTTRRERRKHRRRRDTIAPGRRTAATSSEERGKDHYNGSQLAHGPTLSACLRQREA